MQYLWITIKPLWVLDVPRQFMAKSSILQDRALKSSEPRKRDSSPKGKTSNNIAKQSKTMTGEMLSWPWEYQTQESVKWFILFLWSNEHVVIHWCLLLKSSRRISEQSIDWNLWCSSLNAWDMKAPLRRGWNWDWTSHIAVQSFSCSSVGRGGRSWILSGAKRWEHLSWGDTSLVQVRTPAWSDEWSRPVIAWDMLHKDLEIWQNGSACNGWKQMSHCQEGLEIRHFQSN